MRQKIATAVLELTTEHGAFFKNLDEVENRAGRLDKSWRDTGKTLQAFGKQTSDVGAAMTKMSLPLLAVGLGAAKAAIDFESSFAGVRKTVDATETEFAALSEGFRALAKTIPVNVNELNRLGEAAGALGIPKAEIVDFARVMALLGVTTNVTSDQAAESIAKIQNIFGAAGKDTERFASTLVALGNDGASTEDQILSLANRIASAGNAVGLTQGQVLGFASAIANVGIEAEAGGSAMSKTLIEISQAVSKGGADLAKFAKVAGVSSAEFAKAFREDAADATRMFIEGLGRIKREGGDLNTVIEGLGVTEIRQSNLLRSLALSGDNVAKSLNIQAKAWEENSALSKEAGERFKTVASQLTLLWNRLQDVAIVVGNALVPAITAAISILNGVLPIIEGMAKGFTALPGVIQLSVVALGALLVAAGPVVFVLGTMITQLGIVTTAMWTFGNTVPVLTARLWLMQAAASQAGLIMSGFASGIAVVGVAFASWKLGRWFGEWSGATDIIGRLSSKIGEMIGLLPEGANEQYKAMRAAQKAAEAAKEQAAALGFVTDAAHEFVGPMQQVTGATAASEEELKAAKKSAEEFAKSLKALGGSDALSGAKEVIKQLHALGGPLNVLPSKLGEMAAQLRAGAEAALTMKNVNLANQYTLLAKTLDPIVQFQQRYNVTIGEFITDSPDYVGAIQDQIDAYNNVDNTIRFGIAGVRAFGVETTHVFQRLGKWDFRDLREEMDRTFGRKTWEDMWSGMKAGLSKTLSDIPQTLANAFTGGGDILGAIKSIVSQVGSSIGSSIGFAIGGPMGQQLGAAIGSMAGMVVGPLKKIFGIGVNEAVKTANAEIGRLRNQLLDTHGPLEDLERKANAVGLSFRENWGHQGQAGLKAFQGLVEEFTKRWEALNASLTTARDAFAGLLNDARQLGYEFNEAGELVGVNFQKMQEAAQRYGVDLAGLGPAFQAARLHAAATEIINDFTLLTKGGADVGGVLFGMREEISALVSDSIRFGVEIPENMRPWIEELIRSGQLTDENGDKITDLTGIKFGEPVATEFEKITNKLQELISQIAVLVNQIAGQIGPAMDNVARDRAFTVTAQYHDPGPPDGFGSVGGHGAIPMAEGGMGRVNSPTLFLAGEAGPEDVAFSGAGKRFGGGDVDFSELQRDFKELRREMARDRRLQPSINAAALRDALAMAGAI